MVPKVGLEPTRHHWRQILSLVRLPFRHFGNREMFRGGESATSRERGFGHLSFGTIRTITILRPPPKIKLKRKKSEEKAVRAELPARPPEQGDDERKRARLGSEHLKPTLL